jgi:hypothetical protein
MLLSQAVELRIHFLVVLQDAREAAIDRPLPTGDY